MRNFHRIWILHFSGDGIMFKKTMKKVVCGALTLASTVACLGTFTACETSHPEVSMVLEFNGKPYELEYKLYRKITPSTVNHFLWLVDSGYYEGLCVHDYDEKNLKMYTGAYDYEENTLVEKDYFSFVVNHKDYASFPHSVWMDNEKSVPLHTLRGEFDKNSVGLDKGEFIKESFGTLTMYYYQKNSESRIYMADGQGGTTGREYDYNAVTSMFYISMSTSSSSTSSYCTFATLKKGEDKLKALQKAIDDYVEDLGEDESFVEERTLTVDKYDPIVSGNNRKETFEMPKEPIIIKSISVKKY